MLFNLDFASNTISLCFFFFFLLADLYFLNHVVIAQMFNPITELVMSTGIPTKEAKADMETLPITVEIKMSQCSV